jgi:glyoxylase-like metal-dependent hydrolase (beta-lactamase superfamily II)
MEQVAPQVYVHEYSSGNVGFVQTGAGTVCIDSPMLPSDIRDWRQRIATITREPIVLLIQSDYDQARVVGSRFFDVPLIAHDATWDRLKIYSSEKTLNQINGMLEADGGTPDWRIRMPDITFSQQLLLHKGDCEIRVIYGGGHSCATSMVFLPQHKLVFSGDLVFCSQHPTMNYAETRQWVVTLDRLSRMPIETIIPGHGPVCTSKAAAPLRDYIQDMRNQVRESFENGKSKSETSAAVIAEFLDAFPFTDKERDERRLRIKGGSDRIYDEYRALAKANASRASRVGSSATTRGKSKRAKKRS